MPHFIERRKVFRKRQYFLLDHLIDFGDKKRQGISHASPSSHLRYNFVDTGLRISQRAMEFFAWFPEEEHLCVVCLSAPPNCF